MSAIKPGIKSALPVGLLFLLCYLMAGAKHPLVFFPLFSVISFFAYSRLLKSGYRLPWRIYLPAGLLVLWTLVSLRPPFDSGLFEVSKAVCYLAFAVLFANSKDDRSVVYFGVAVVACATMESFLLAVRFHALGPKGGLLVGNPTYSALLIATGICFLVSFLTVVSGEKRMFPKPLSVLLLLVLTVGLGLTQSRGVTLACMVSVAVLLPFRTRVVFIFLVPFFLVGFLYFYADFLKLDLDSQATVFGRIGIWKTALISIPQHWFAGVGPGNFELAYRLNQLPVGPVLYYSLTTMFAHNDYLQVMVETGLVGFGLLAWTIFSLVQSRSTLPRTSIFLFAKSVLLLFGVSAFFNFNFYLPLNGLLAAGAFGIFSGGIRDRTEIFSSRSGLIGLWMLLGTLSIVLLLMGVSDVAVSKKNWRLATATVPFRAEAWYGKALDRLSGGNRDASSAHSILDSLRIALLWNPNDPFLWSRCARIMAQVTPAEDVAILPAFAKSIALAPKHAPFWLDRGFYFLSKNRTAEAKKDFLAALTLEPNAPLPFYALASVYSREKNDGAAVRLLRHSLALKRRYEAVVTPSAYASYLFGIDESKITLIIRHYENKPVL